MAEEPRVDRFPVELPDRIGDALAVVVTQVPDGHREAVPQRVGTLEVARIVHRSLRDSALPLRVRQPTLAFAPTAPRLMVQRTARRSRIL
jgi:hypothetical protein